MIRPQREERRVLLEAANKPERFRFTIYAVKTMQKNRRILSAPDDKQQMR